MWFGALEGIVLRLLSRDVLEGRTALTVGGKLLPRGSGAGGGVWLAGTTRPREIVGRDCESAFFDNLSEIGPILYLIGTDVTDRLFEPIILAKVIDCLI